MSAHDLQHKIEIFLPCTWQTNCTSSDQVESQGRGPLCTGPHSPSGVYIKWGRGSGALRSGAPWPRSRTVQKKGNGPRILSYSRRNRHSSVAIGTSALVVGSQNLKELRAPIDTDLGHLESSLCRPEHQEDSLAQTMLQNSRYSFFIFMTQGGLHVSRWKVLFLWKSACNY